MKKGKRIILDCNWFSGLRRDDTFSLNRNVFYLDNSFIHHGMKYYGEDFNFKVKELFSGLYY